MDAYERQAMIERLRAENAETLADMAERRARRLAGEEPREWQLPENQDWRKSAPISKAPILSREAVDAIGQALARERYLMREHVEKRMGELAALMGEETARVHKA